MEDSAEKEEGRAFRSGYVSITGRPNVGKSTFLNAVLGRKVSIVTSRPQTTRNRIVGVKTLRDAQVVFIDTPGIHAPKDMLGSHMVREARRAVREVDLVLLMVEPRPPSEAEKYILRMLGQAGKPVFLLINKVDKVRKPALLPVMDLYGGLYPFEEIIPVSALRGEGLDTVLSKVVGRLKPGPRFYPDDIFTDSLERFMAAEAVREKVMEATEEEVPHSVAVEVVEWKEREKGGVFLRADILVEKSGQKGIIIGKGGSRLRDIGSAARRDMERLLGTSVFLELFVKVKKGWRTDRSALMELGFK